MEYGGVYLGVVWCSGEGGGITVLKNKKRECGIRYHRILTIQLLTRVCAEYSIAQNVESAKNRRGAHIKGRGGRGWPSSQRIFIVVPPQGLSIINSGFRPHRLDLGKDQAVGNN